MTTSIRRAIISVSDKTGLEVLGPFLVEIGFEILSTGGTATRLRDLGVSVTDVGEYTGFPEIMNGRVKTLHPKVHGGILAIRGNEQHESAMTEHDIQPIDLIVVNLYPFQQTVSRGGDFEDCIENIDIGGPTMVRAAAKNHSSVTIVTSPLQYASLMEEMRNNGGNTTLELRRRFAAAAFAHTANYDSAISSWFADQLGDAANQHVRIYNHEFNLKYGCNPHQIPAAMLSLTDAGLPFTILNGVPGYINLLDALNAWSLVRELRQALGLPSAASFKHVSPAGAAVSTPLSSDLNEVYENGDRQLSPLATAYLRARNADPMSSFGDFVALSDRVDVDTANLLKREVSDGVIAPDYEEEALKILATKKGGKYIVLQAKSDFSIPPVEYREVGGAAFMQRRNDVLFSQEHIANVVTESKEFSPEASRDLILASITLKYTQSNSVGYAVDGQMIGVGAGQQSRVDCVKLAGRKVDTWLLRQHPKVRSLPFKTEVKRQDRVNARVRYIEGDFTEPELIQWRELFTEVPEMLSVEEKEAFLQSIAASGVNGQGVSLSSDAFFPFRDSIDQASKRGVRFVAQPGGSVADDVVIAACNEYGMTMAFSNFRLFHH